jgi:hypothetical protein
MYRFRFYIKKGAVRTYTGQLPYLIYSFYSKTRKGVGKNGVLEDPPYTLQAL